MPGALEGLRVLDWSDETGRLAAKLLAEAGADVLRLRRGSPGRPLAGPDGVRGGILDWWFDAGVRRCELDLTRPADRAAFVRLAARADLLIETTPPGYLADLDIDYAALARDNARLVQVSLTPFGRTGPRAAWQVTDLVAGALGGPLSVTGIPEQPLNTFGRQWFNVGGFHAAICGLAGVHQARACGLGQHIDLALHQAVISCTEQLLMYWFFSDWFGPIAPRQGSLHWTGIYQVMPCRTGFALMTPAPRLAQLWKWITEEGMGDVLPQPPPLTFADLVQRSREVMDGLRRWAATKDAHELFAEAQRRHLALAEVLTLRGAAESAQLRTRGFFRPASGTAGVTLPGPLCRLQDCPAPAPAPPPADSVTTEEVLNTWPPAPAAEVSASPGPDGKPLQGIRVLDFTWVLAGPFATRILADLGADVVKLQTEERTTGASHNDHPFFIMWNRNKRSAGLNMKHGRAGEIFRRLVERSDVVVDNFSPGVLERWGIGYDVIRQWNPGIIHLAMSGCGRDGPWRDLVTYAPTIHALSGLTHLTNPPGHGDLGCGVSLSDHMSGLAGVLAVLEALAHRQRTGRGQLIDLAQLEVGAYLLGPAFLELLVNGTEAQPTGHRDAFADLEPNNLYRCADERWIAVTARTDDEWLRLCSATGDAELAADERLRLAAGRREHIDHIDRRIGAWVAARQAADVEATLQSSGVPAGVVQDARDLAESDPQLRARAWLTTVQHTSLGTQQIDRFPARFGRSTLEPYRASPTLHEHTFEVYGELLGMSDQEIAAALADGLFV